MFLILWSLFTGFGYTLLCYHFDIVALVPIWFLITVTLCLWGWKLYSKFDTIKRHQKESKKWYLQIQLFFYSIFGLWTILFLYYSDIKAHNLNQVTLLLQGIWAMIALTFLFTDKKLFLLLFLMILYSMLSYFLGLKDSQEYFLSMFILGFFIWILYISRDSWIYTKDHFNHSQRDSLTGFYNRRTFIEHINKQLYRVKEQDRYAFVILVNVDHLKSINGRLGEDIGDRLLCDISYRMLSTSELKKSIFRLGGDEFAMMSTLYTDNDTCIKSAEKLSQSLESRLKEEYIIEKNQLQISVTLGIKILDRSIPSATEVIKELDHAMYEAKSLGKQGVLHINHPNITKIADTLEIERRFYYALKYHEIELYYQPQVNIDGDIIGCEVLSRWYNPRLGMKTSIELFHMAGEIGILNKVSNFMMEESFKTLKRWEEKEYNLKHFSINITVRQLLHEDFFKHLKSLCSRYLNQVSQNKIVFEMTEKVLKEDREQVVSMMKKVKKLGMAFSLDKIDIDAYFLNDLREFPIEELKIDGEFVHHTGKNRSHIMKLESIISLARKYQLRVIAEGIETKNQLEIFKGFDCHIYQGYYFDKPLNRDEFEVKLFHQKVKKVKYKVEQIEMKNGRMVV